MDDDLNNKGKLNILEKKLYSRNSPNIIGGERAEFKGDFPLKDNPNNNWESSENGNFDSLVSKMSNLAQNKYKFINKIFFISLSFFVMAFLATIFVFVGGGNIVSSKNVDIAIFGPISVPAGQEFSLNINVVNNNNVNLDSASLLIEYPPGVRSSDDLSKDIDRQRLSIGNIKSKENYDQDIKVIFFGEKESIKDIKVSIEYRVENSSALFYKEKKHQISISSAPVVVVPIYPKEANSNQDINFDLSIASNSKDKIGNLLVRVEYPAGFVFKDSVPKTSFDQNIWKFSSLSSGEKKNISIKGSIFGQNNEERIFRISVGTADEDDERIISVPLSELTESILVKKPFIGLDLSLNDKDSNIFVTGGSRVSGEIIVRNNLPSKIFNVSAEIFFEGAAFDELSVDAGNGFFQSINDTILWDKRSIPVFADMRPGSDVRLPFSLSPYVYSKISQGVKPEINLTLKVKGERILDSGSVEQILSTETRKIILGTDVYLDSKIVRSLGDIENSGPIPPRVDIPTTYTVFWSIENSFNQLSNVEVKAVLPSYVKWTNVKNPISEDISFNNSTNEIIWDAGSVLPGAGFNSAKKSISFQIEFLPSSSQIGESPVLLGITKLVGIDKITGLKVESNVSELTTNFSSDPDFGLGDEKVFP